MIVVSWRREALAVTTPAGRRAGPAVGRSPSRPTRAAATASSSTRANDLYDQGTAAMTNGIPSDQRRGTSPRPPRCTRRRGPRRAATRPWAPTRRSRCSTAATSTARSSRSTSSSRQTPSFQQGLFNKGIFLATRRASPRDGARGEDSYIASARAAFTAAVAIDPQSDIGKQADSAIQSLNQTQ